MSEDPWSLKFPWVTAVAAGFAVMLLYWWGGLGYALAGLLGIGSVATLFVFAQTRRNTLQAKVGLPEGRRPELTALRGIASLWVVVYHANLILIGASFFPIISAGYLGVSIFFVLSICLLLQSLDKNDDLKHYFTRRIRRIWPMYFATIVMVFFYYGFSIPWLAEQVSFSAVFYNNAGIHYVFWSLQVEEVAYLFFPLIHRLSDSWKYRMGIGLYVSGVLSAIIVLNGLNPYLVFNYWWLPLSLSAYGLGILVYLRKVPSIALISCFLGLVFWADSIFAALSCLAAPGFAYIVQESHRYKILQNKHLIKVGDVSYGLYLIHWLLLTSLGWLGAAICIPAAWLFEKANVLGLKGADRLIARLRA